MKQYFQLQEQYPDYFIFMEIGSFYEIMQVGDLGYAKKAAEVADLTLTKKNKSSLDSPHMAGFPSHTAEGYFKKIVESGHRIVVVSQVTEYDDKNQKKISRKIEKILSPGVVVDNLSAEKPNYFAAIFEEFDAVGIALIDVSTGEVKVTETKKEQLAETMEKIQPAEILFCSNVTWETEKFKVLHTIASSEIKKISSSGHLLGEFYNIKSPTSDPAYALSVLGLNRWRLAAMAFSNLLNFIASTEYNLNLLKKLSEPKIYNEIEFLTIPMNGYLSLDIISNQQNSKDTLVYILDHCKTAMGKRKLRDWINYPLVAFTAIQARFDKVSGYIERDEYFEELKEVYDIQRLSRRMLLGRLMPHEILQFYNGLKIIENILDKEKNENLKKIKILIKYLKQNIDFDKIENHFKDYGFFSGELLDSVKVEYDATVEAQKQAFKLKHDFEKIIKAQTGVEKNYFRLEKKKDNYQLIGAKGLAQYSNLIALAKKTNSVEITDKKWEEVSDRWLYKEAQYIQKSSLAWEQFQKKLMDKFGLDINKISEAVAEIDVLTNFAKLSKERHYSRPRIVEKPHAYFRLESMRHPIIELSKNLKDDFIPNDVFLNETNDIMVLYGANSAGKSTILKSVALNIIMAQIGCFIAAGESSELSAFEAILTRMTTYDSLSEGLSTFTMEMKELQSALKFRKKRALFLLDEIGRGTSVEDGEAIAYATLDYLSQEKNNSVAFFATHYHGLGSKIGEFKNISIKNMDCWLDDKLKLKFSRKLKDGVGTGSYGIDVAASCGLPDSLVRIAQNYNKKYAPLKISRYNAQVEGIICPICNENAVQETHHVIDQKQGTVKSVVIRGITRHINHKENLIMICASCHHKITQEEIKLIKE